jgi:hypothetical protein
MINVICHKCAHEECKKQPTYNLSGRKIGLYCTLHKKDGMINVKCKLCAHPNCIKQPSYNNKDEKNVLYCSEHKKDGMVNVKDTTCKVIGVLQLFLKNMMVIVCFVI